MKIKRAVLTASPPQTDRPIVLIVLIALREGCKNHWFSNLQIQRIQRTASLLSVFSLVMTLLLPLPVASVSLEYQPLLILLNLSASGSAVGPVTCVLLFSVERGRMWFWSAHTFLFQVKLTVYIGVYLYPPKASSVFLKRDGPHFLLFFLRFIYYVYSVLLACMPVGQKRAPNLIMDGCEPPCRC